MMNTILVVEDEEITSDLLRRYFNMVGYDVVNALTGKDAIQKAVDSKPTVIILDIMLPDMDGYEICKRLRSDERTDQIPIIFLTQKDDRRDRLDGLGLGADDYITKPFDIEELRLRVHNIISRLSGTSLVDARTSLPNMALIKDRLPRLLEDENSVFVNVQVLHIQAFTDKYGPVSQNQVIRSVAKTIGDVLHTIDPRNSFVGHPRDDHFLLAFSKEHLERVETELAERFSKNVRNFYDYTDAEAGHMIHGDKTVPFLDLKLFKVKPEALHALIKEAEERARQQSKA